MNVNTGELRLLAQGGGRDSEVRRAIVDGFIMVPKEHEEEAEKILADKKQAIADMTIDTPLVSWAKSQQIKILQRHSKTKREMRKKSQRINRGK